MPTERSRCFAYEQIELRLAIRCCRRRQLDRSAADWTERHAIDTLGQRLACQRGTVNRDRSIGQDVAHQCDHARLPLVAERAVWVKAQIFIEQIAGVEPVPNVAAAAQI